MLGITACRLILMRRCLVLSAHRVRLTEDLANRGAKSLRANMNRLQDQYLRICAT